MIVLDASVVVELVLRTPTGARIAGRLARATSWHAPHLLDVEVTQVVRRLARSRAISAEAARQALEDMIGLDLTRYAHDPLVPRMWELRANLTAYDAAYVALAEALDAVLLTCDSRLASAVGHRAAIEVIAA